MRLGHRRALVGAPHLHGDDGDLAPCRRVGGELQGPPVLEALDVAGHGARGLEAREVVDEVGRLHVGLVAGRGPVGELDADLLPLEHRAALVAALGDQRDRLSREVLAEDLEGVEIGVRPEDVELTALDDPLHLLLEPLPLGSHLGEPGREDDGELRLRRHRVAQDRQRLADQDRHQVQLLLDVGQGLGAGTARHLRTVGVDEVHRGTPLLGPQRDLLGQRRVGPCVGVRGPHDGHPLRAEERVQVDGAEGGRAAGDVHPVACRRGPCCHVPPSCRAALPSAPVPVVPCSLTAAAAPRRAPARCGGPRRARGGTHRI